MLCAMKFVLLASFFEVLRDILMGIIRSILSPVIEAAIMVVYNLIISAITDWFTELLLAVWIAILNIVNLVEKVFNIFSGIDPVIVNDAGSTYKTSLLNAMIAQKPVANAFTAMTSIALVLCIFTTLIATIASMSDSIGEMKRPVSAVLRSVGRAGLTFALVPFSCVIILTTAGAIGENVMYIFGSGNTNTGISDVLFTTVAAAGGTQSKLAEYEGGQRFNDIDQVKKDFNTKKFDYVVAIVSSIMCLIIMIMCILQFIQRIIVVLLLYLISPYFVAYIPLDDGAKFKQWRELFIGYMVSAFGPIFAMRVYLLLIPFISNGTIIFSGVADEVAMILKIIFIVGGAYAIFMSKLLILSLVSQKAADNAQNAMSAGMGYTKLGALGGVGALMSMAKKNTDENKSQVDAATGKNQNAEKDSGGNKDQQFTG